MTARQTRFFAHAKSVAEMSDFRVRVGAVIVLGKQILSAGFISTRSHSIQARYDKYRNFRSGSEPKHSLHAEMMALIPLMNDKDIDWKRVEIYVFRICGDREFGMARPCASCMAALIQFGIRNIFYTTDIGFAYEQVAA